MKRKYYSREVFVGNLVLGGHRNLLVQSMTNTPTTNTPETTEQIKRLATAGCDIIRVTTATLKEVESLKIIKQNLATANINIPLVADVHYSPLVAEKAAMVADKVRINPGNYLTDKTKEHYSDSDFIAARQQITQNIKPLIQICKQHHTALRVGVNWGSLSKRILYRYGNTAIGMVASALEFIEILTAEGFEQFTLSLKASDVRIMQEANVMLVQEMIKRNTFFPLHLGVTEAGTGNDGRIKSAAGIGALLQFGIGNTIRVSLTENPEAEIPVAKKLLPYYNKEGVSSEALKKLCFHPVKLQKKIVEAVGHNKPLVVSSPGEKLADLHFNAGSLYLPSGKYFTDSQDLKLTSIQSNNPGFESFLIDAALRFSVDFLKNDAQAIFLQNPHFSPSALTKLSFDILQGLGLRYSKTEYIACPSCGRTQFNIMEQLKRVRQKTAGFKGLKIAVMGCMVNGPGEMAEADYGFTGSGKGTITLYRANTIVKKNIPEADAVDALLELIKSDIQS